MVVSRIYSKSSSKITLFDTISPSTIAVYIEDSFNSLALSVLPRAPNAV